MDDSSIDLGLTDGSLLVLHKQHRSRAVWEGYGNPKVENVTLICRRNDNNLRQLGRPSPRIVELIYQAGFGGILEMPFITLDHAFITALIERWRPETHTFHLRSGESTVTLQDVKIITGLAVDGRPVTGDTRFDQDKKKELCERLLGLNLPGEVMSGFKISLKWLRENFDGKVEEEDDEVTVLRKARGYILQLIGDIILSDQSSSHVHLCFLSLLDDLQLAGTYSWGSACLVTLYHYLDFGSIVGSKDFEGCSYSCKFGVGIPLQMAGARNIASSSCIMNMPYASCTWYSKLADSLAMAAGAGAIFISSCHVISTQDCIILVLKYSNL